MTDQGPLPTSSPDVLGPLINVSIEGWRFARVYARAVSKLDASEQQKYISQHRYFLQQLETQLDGAGLRFVNFEGHQFDPGLPITPLNLEEFEAKDMLVIDQMLEPTVMGPNGLLRMGSALLKRLEP